MTYREAYETWLKEFADDRATVDELKAIAGDEKEIEERFYTELSFGAEETIMEAQAKKRATTPEG